MSGLQLLGAPVGKAGAAGKVLGSDDSALDINNPLLLFPPPVQTTPTVVNVPTTFYEATFAADEDVIFVWPEATRTRNFVCNGGRRVIVVGGTMLKGAALGSVQFKKVRESIFVEALEIDQNGFEGDILDVMGINTGEESEWTFPDITVVNCRLLNATGLFSGTHSDIFQTQGPAGRLFVDKLTATTDYQGFFIPAQPSVNNSSLIEAVFNRVNIKMLPAKDPEHKLTSSFWLYGTDETIVPYPASFNHVYVDLSDPERITSAEDPAAVVVAPFSSKEAVGGGLLPAGTKYGAINNAAKTEIHFGKDMPYRGVVKIGTPPGGDFVPAGIGTKYATPGYQKQPPPPKAVRMGELVPKYGTLAARPAPNRAGEGFRYFATDVNGGTEYRVKYEKGVWSWVAATAGLTPVGLPTVVTLAADLATLNESTTPIALTGLSFAIGASATEMWHFEMWLQVEAANATMDIKTSLTVPAGATFRWGGVGNPVNALGWGANATASEPIPLTNGTQANGTKAGVMGLLVAGVVYGGGTAGNVQPNYAQNTKDAGNLKPLKGSFIRAMKIAS